MMNKTEIGARIRKFRKQAGITQEMLGEKIGVGSNYISVIERGIKLPKLETFIKITESLNISADQLLTGCTNAGKFIQCYELWEQLKDLPPEKFQFIMNVLKVMLEQYQK